MDYIYGKLNKEVELQQYTGLSTDTATTIVDNINHTISVEMKGIPESGNINREGYLSFKEDQLLTQAEIDQLYHNLKLNSFLDDNVILVDKVSQMINGDLLINKNLRVKERYINLNVNNIPLKNGERAGVLIKNWTQDKDALIYVNNEGKLWFSNDSYNREILTKTDNLDYNKFTYYSGQSLSTRDILPNDINTQDYVPSKDIDLVTKKYVDKSMRQNMNYAIVANQEEFSKLNAWEGRRVLILEEVKA